MKTTERIADLMPDPAQVNRSIHAQVCAMENANLETETSPYAGHTPGPWRNDDGKIYDAEDRLVCDVSPGEIGLDEADEANARLIADAPALLAERDALRAENERLRAALEIIHANAAESAEWIRRHATAALEGGKWT